MMKKGIYTYLLTLTLGAGCAYSQSVSDGFPNLQGLSYGFGIEQYEDTLTSSEAFAGGTTNLVQEEEYPYYVFEMGVVQNQDPVYFNMDFRFGWSGDATAEYSGQTVANGQVLPQNRSIDFENPWLLEIAGDVGYNIQVGSSFRIRPVIGYRIDYRTSDVETQGGQSGSFLLNSTTLTQEYMWHGFTYGAQFDWVLGDALIYGGVEFIEASPDISFSGSSLLGSTSDGRDWDGDGTQVELGIIFPLGDLGICYLTGHVQSLEAEATGSGSGSLGAVSNSSTWEIDNMGITAGIGLGF
jgi:hypothetical protein